MPAGVGWGEYLRFTIAAMLAMAAGSQVVHSIYKPLDGLDDLIAQKQAEIVGNMEEPSNNKS